MHCEQNFLSKCTTSDSKNSLKSLSMTCFYDYSVQLIFPDMVEGLVLLNIDPNGKGWIDWAATKVPVYKSFRSVTITVGVGEIRTYSHIQI